jgi:hypothetical protein
MRRSPLENYLSERYASLVLPIKRLTQPVEICADYTWVDSQTEEAPLKIWAINRIDIKKMISRRAYGESEWRGRLGVDCEYTTL